MRGRLPFLLALAAAATFVGPPAVLGAPPEPGPSADALDAPRWEVRRAAERALETEGVAALEAATDGEAGRTRLAAWSKEVEDRLAAGGPAAVDALERVLRRLEAHASDDQARREPRLLRARLDRLLPQTVTERGESAAASDEEAVVRMTALAASSVAVRGLFPEARAELLSMITGRSAGRALAGAVAALCGEVGRGPEDDATLTALAAAWGKDPERVEAILDYTDADGTRSPTSALALALALSGRAAALAHLRTRIGTFDDGATLQWWLQQRLPQRGLGDMTFGEFLVRVEESRATAADEAEAARRALAADLPWLARLCARRALFLDAGHAGARETLGKADVALKLFATARRDSVVGEPGGAPEPAGDEAQDAPGAKAADDAMRAGRTSMRLAAQIDLGEGDALSVVPVAIEGATLVHGMTHGEVVLADPGTGQATSAASTRIQRIPRAIAVSKGVVVAVSGRGGVLFWKIENDGLEPAGMAGGPYTRVVTGSDGAFWFVGAHRTIYRADGAEAPKKVEKIASVQGWFSDAMAPLSDGALLLIGAAGSDEATVVRIDPATGTENVLARGDRANLRTAAFGADVLVSEGPEFRWLGADGAPKGRGTAPDGESILGLGGDASSGTVYMALNDALVAAAAADGAVRWLEHVEGGDDPVVGSGLVCVTAGAGEGRTNHTLYVFRAGVDAVEPFGIEQRVRAVDLAVSAAEAGLVAVTEAILDPVSVWLATGERWAAQNAVREALARGRRARGEGPKPALRADTAADDELPAPHDDPPPTEKPVEPKPPDGR